MDPLLVFRALDIHLEGAPFNAVLPASWIDASIADANLALGVGDWEARSRPEGGGITGRISRSGDDVVVRGTIDAEIVLACSRCLGPVSVGVGSELTLLLKPVTPPVADRSGAARRKPRASSSKASQKASNADEGPEYEFSADEAGLDTYDGETVVLDAFVREAILLELPQFPLCSEQCSGLNEQVVGAGMPAGEADAVDPRFAALGALRARMGSEAASPLAASLELAEAATIAPKPVLRASGHRAASKAKKKSRGKE